MADSSTDSDCFESADEGFDDENNINFDNANSGKRGSRLVESPSPSFIDAQSAEDARVSQENNPSEGSLQYRKRPDRRKNIPKIVPAVSPQNRKTSLNDQIFKPDIKPDVFIQDITNNLSKNLNKGFNTIQQTSSSIKDLVMSSLPVTAQKETVNRFSYDEEIPPQQSESDSENENNSASEINQEKCKFKNVQQDSCMSEKINDDIPKTCLKYSNTEISTVKNKNIIDLNLSSAIDAVQISDISTVKNEAVTDISSEANDNAGILENSGDESEPKEIFAVDDNQKSAQDDIDIHMTKDISEMSNIQESLKGGNNSYPKMQIKCASDFEKGDPEDLLGKDGNYKIQSEIQEVVADSLNEKDGWDSSELDLEGLDVEGSFDDSSVLNEGRSINKIEEKIDESNVAELNSQTNENEGWDDFDFDDEDTQSEVEVGTVATSAGNTKNVQNEFSTLKNKDSSSHFKEYNRDTSSNNTWSGWDNFGEKAEKKQKSAWSLGGWGVNALLNTATSVTQGLSNVLEVGLGAPDPETLARMEIEANSKDIVAEDRKNYRSETRDSSQVQTNENSHTDKNDDSSSSGLNLFPGFGITNLVAEVTNKIVEHSVVQEIGSKVISGGLDTLESFGKKTMEVLQEGDPGLKKKRALLLGSDKPILSQVLREAKAKAEIQDKKMEEKQMAKMCHFETLFDDFHGLVHLEALEMLSRQCELKLEQMKASLSMKEVEDLIGILDEVKELCLIDEDEFKSNYSKMIDFKDSLKKAIEPLKNEISIHKIIKEHWLPVCKWQKLENLLSQTQVHNTTPIEENLHVGGQLEMVKKSNDDVHVYEDLNAWLKLEENCKGSPQMLFQKVMSTLAELTSATVQQFHKGGELLSVKEHRKTVEEADSLLQMTGFLCCEINKIAEKFLNLYKSDPSEFSERMAKKIKEEAVNATSYIKDAFNLLIPVLQLGAAA